MPVEKKRREFVREWLPDAGGRKSWRASAREWHLLQPCQKSNFLVLTRYEAEEKDEVIKDALRGLEADSDDDKSDSDSDAGDFEYLDSQTKKVNRSRRSH